MENKLAIVIPYYKIDFFEETIQSLSVQTDLRFTIYIGNDASPDNPLPIIESYLANYSYFYYDYTENLGGKNLALQWERILQFVKEDWFMILGDDDRIAPNFVEEFYKHQSNFTGVNLIKVRNTIVKEKDILKHDFTGNLQAKSYNTVDFFLQKMQGKMNSSLSEHIFRKQAFQGFRKYPLAWHDDDWALLSITQCGSFYFLKDTQVLIREYAGSISGKADNLDKKNEASDLFYKELVSLFYQHQIPNAKKDLFIDLYVNKYPKTDKYTLYTTLYGSSMGTYKLLRFYAKNYLNLMKS